MAGNSESAITVSAQLSAKQLIGVTFAAISSVLVGALYITTWSVERSINDIEQKIVDVSNTTSALIDKLESTMGKEIATLEVELKTLASIVNEQENKTVQEKATSVSMMDDVGEVKTKVEKVDDKVVNVAGEVKDVNHKVERISTKIVDADITLQNVRKVFIKTLEKRPELLQEMLNPSLSVGQPPEFYEEEPTKGAALPDTGLQSADELSGDRTDSESIKPVLKTIADHCQAQSTDVLECYEFFLDKYDQS